MDEGHDEIVESPGDDDAVVDVQPEDDGHGGVADPLERRQCTWRPHLTWRMGTSWPTMVRPPVPRYCPAATSWTQKHDFRMSRNKLLDTWKKTGMPQANMAMK